MNTSTNSVPSGIFVKQKWKSSLSSPSSSTKIRITVESKGFWRGCIELRITGFVDFVHRQEF
jgi:hypothetical protein